MGPHGPRGRSPPLEISIYMGPWGPPTEGSIGLMQTGSSGQSENQSETQKYQSETKMISKSAIKNHIKIWMIPKMQSKPKENHQHRQKTRKNTIFGLGDEPLRNVNAPSKEALRKSQTNLGIAQEFLGSAQKTQGEFKIEVP